MNPVDFVERMYAAGAQGYFDALSFHPYQYTTKFTEGSYHPDSPINQPADIHDLIVTNGDGDKLVWASEFGVPTDQFSEAHQAEYIGDFLEGWSDQSYTGPAFIYTFRDNAPGAQGEEASMGVVRADGSWKPAARVIQQWTATHPQLPDPVTLTVATAPTTATTTTAPATATVEAMEATAVPQTATTTEPIVATETVPAPTETATAPTATATDPSAGATTADPTGTATEPMGTADSTSTAHSTGTTDSTTTTDSTDSSSGTSSTDSTSSDSTDSGSSSSTSDSTDAAA